MTTAEAPATAPALASLYQVMPPMSDEDFQRLKESISAYYSRHGAPFWPGFEPLVDEEGRVLDGHHRLRACAELGLDATTRQVETWSDDDKWDFAYRANLARRHLTFEQRRELVKAYLRRYPEKSDRAAAQAAGVSPTTAGSVRRDLVENGHIEETVRPHQRLDQGASVQMDSPKRAPKAEDEAWHPSDVAERLYPIDVELFVEFQIRSETIRKRGDKEYPREAERVRIDLSGPFDFALRERGEEGIRELATGIARNIVNSRELKEYWDRLP